MNCMSQDHKKQHYILQENMLWMLDDILRMMYIDNILDDILRMMYIDNMPHGTLHMMYIDNMPHGSCGQCTRNYYYSSYKKYMLHDIFLLDKHYCEM